MKWNNEKGFLEYSASVRNIKSLLGIAEIGHIDYICELAPYATYILKYLSEKLSLLEGQDFSILLEEVFNIFDTGSKMIIYGGARDLALEIGIDEGDVYIENEEIPYNQERFIFTWTNIYSSLVTRLKLQYANLLTQSINLECPCDCAPGQTTYDYEKWTSGIYPEDENYQYYTETKTSWRVGNEYPICNNCLRK